MIEGIVTQDKPGYSSLWFGAVDCWKFSVQNFGMAWPSIVGVRRCMSHLDQWLNFCLFDSLFMTGIVALHFQFVSFIEHLRLKADAQSLLRVLQIQAVLSVAGIDSCWRGEAAVKRNTVLLAHWLLNLTLLHLRNQICVQLWANVGLELALGISLLEISLILTRNVELRAARVERIRIVWRCICAWKLCTTGIAVVLVLRLATSSGIAESTSTAASNCRDLLSLNAEAGIKQIVCSVEVIRGWNRRGGRSQITDKILLSFLFLEILLRKVAIL